MTSKYLVYILAPCEGYFPVVSNAVHSESSRLTEMHILSHANTDIHVPSFLVPSFQGSSFGMTSRFDCDLVVFRTPTKLVPVMVFNSRVIGSRVTCCAYSSI